MTLAFVALFRRWYLLPNSLYRAARFANFEGVLGFFCSVNRPSGPRRKHMFTLTSLKGHGLWFVIGGFRSVWFIYCVAWLVIVVCGALVGFLIFLNLVTCENKAMSAFLRQKFHSPSRFPSPFSVLFLRACSNIGICINPAPTQMIDGIGKPKIPSKFAKRAAYYNEFGSKAPISTNSADWSLFP